MATTPTNLAGSWLIAKFKATTFFSLKPASATSSGGKSLLIPTPFAVKMALLDVALRTLGQSEGADFFPAIRDLHIAVRLPAKAIVNNTFIKILRPHKGGPKDVNGTGLLTPMGNTIAFREFVNYSDEVVLAFSSPSQALSAQILSNLVLQINYLGKRGSFIQWQGLPEEKAWSDATLREHGYTLLTETTATFDSRGLLQMVDDCGPSMTFDHANIYSGKNIRLGQERVLHHVVLPYRLVRSSKSYSYYERLDALDARD
jgi:hypothetical protein